MCAVAIEWFYERDEFDRQVSTLDAFLRCAQCLESLLLLQGFSPDLGHAHLPPDRVSKLGKAFISGAISLLRTGKFLPPGLDRALVEALLSRVGEPEEKYAPPNPGGGGVRRAVSQVPTSPTRRDLLFFYLIVKVSYLEAKAAALGRPEPTTDVSHVNQAMQQLLGAPGYHADSLAQLRVTLYGLWAKEEPGGANSGPSPCVQ
jgi:hypothetical protein